MSDMKKLLESISKFSFANPNQKPGDMVRGTEVAGKASKKGHPFKGRLVGTSEGVEYCDACDRPASECVCDHELAENLMQEYKYFVKEADPIPTPGTNAPASPVANINPAGTGTAATNTAPQQTGNAPTAPVAGQTQPAATAAKPAAPAQPAAGQPAATAAKPAAPAQPGQQPVAGQQAPKPGAPATGTVTPPNPQKVKQDTDALTGILNNPAHPMNAQLQALVKKAGSIPK